MRADMSVLTSTEGKDQFYPTPDAVAGKMLAGIDWDYIETVLEPSAGKGDLLRCAVKARHNNIRRGNKKVQCDCIELDPYLRQILKFNFSKEANKELRDRYYELDRMSYSTRTPEEKREYERLREQLDATDSAEVRIVHDDFLSYRGFKRYGLILMNPPFANGDLHLLKALELQKGGGLIVCLLNAETINNPYTNTRRLLMQQLDKYEAKITHIENAFAKAERRADVDVAIVRVDIPYERPRSTIYDRLEQAAKQETPLYEATDLVAGDYLEQMVQHYNVECSAGVELIREYDAMWPYMQRELEKEGSRKPYSNLAILTLSVGTDSNYSQRIDVNDYLREVRLKYWRGLFSSEQFMGKLTSNLREQFVETVEKMADYDFTMYNIWQVYVEMNAGLVDGLKETIMALFDKLTAEHSWYPESANNIHYFNGWKTNKAHKIGKKSIIPTHGMFSSYSWNKDTFDVSTAYKVISDIEKVFNYLDGGMTQEVDLLARLRTADTEGRTRNIECKYFKIDLFKKGTTHIKFTNMELVEKFNIYAARNRNWLPPNYGKASYAEMTTEEKEVVDDFQGADAYAKVLARPGFFLSEPTRSVAMLGDGSTGGG